MKKHLAVCLAVIIALSQLVGLCALADTNTTSAGTEATLITKAKGAYYTVVSGAKATKFGISPNSKGTEYYVDPKQSDSELTFGNSCAEYNKTSYSILDVNVTDNTDFALAKKFTVTNVADFNSITNTSLNLYQGNSTALQEWISVPYADMRFWVKTSCEFTVTLSMACSYNGVYPHIKSRITVPASSDWQEIRITRDDFSDNDQFEKLVELNEGTFYFRMMVADNMLAENETVYISQPKFNNGALDPCVVENIYFDYSYYYNNFQSYNTLKVTDNSYYTSTYNYNNEFRVSLPAITDLSAVNASGSLRFWVNVPKDLTIYFGLASQNSAGTNGRAFCEKALKVEDNDAEGFQEVEIPLSELTEKEGSFSWKDVKFVALRGINNCTSDTFLAVGESLKISPIEVWSNTAPEPKAAYTYVPKYYSVTGNVTVVDLNAAMDSRTQINAFAHSSFSDEYLQIAEDYESNTQLLKVYNVTAVIAGAVESETSYGEYSEYAVTEADTDMSVLIPVTEEMLDYDLVVGVADENGFRPKSYEKTDEYLIVTTSELGDFLIMGIQTPVYTASVTGSTIYDNTILTSGVEVVRVAETAEYQPIMSFSGSSSNAPSADIINEWLADEDAQMSIWVKAPYKSEGTVNTQIDLCLRTNSNYLHKYANVTLVADGYWHELRINASAFSGNSFTSITENNYLNFYIRIKSNAKGNEYWIGPDITFYNSPITSEVNDGNIILEQVAAIDTADGYGGGCTNISVQKNIAISGNKFYNTAVAYSVTDATNYTFSQDNVLPYKIGTPTGNEFKEVVTNGGDARTYVKNVSDHEMTFTVGVKTWCKVTETGSGGNFLLNKTVTVPNDGKWHEVRISFKNLKTEEYKLNALKGVEGYTYGTVYLRIYDLNDDFTTTDDKLYITPLAIYNRSLIGSESADINDANVVLEQIASVETASGGWSHKSVSGASVNIADNKFYRSAFKYTVTDVATQSFSSNTYPYINTNITIDELTDYFKYRGDMRTYVKNTSDHTMTFSIGIKVKYNSSSNAESRFKTVEIPGGGKWHEVRISYSDLFVNTTDNIYKAMNGIDEYTLNELYLKINGLTGQFTSTDDELYFTALEIYNRNIDTAETTDFAREYKQAMLLKNYRSDKTDTHISKASAAVENASPFFSNAVTFTANDTYTAGYASGQIGFVHGSGIDAEAFADWYYNDNADLRIWLKAEKDTKFKLGIFVSGNNYGEVVSSVIDASASSDWQLITIPRSAFNSSNQIVTAISGRDTIDVNIFFYSVDGTFANAGDSISIAQCVEVYSDKAYDKCDANCDEQVDIRDLVHIKKQAVEIGANVKNCDIDNSGDIDTPDLAIMRKNLLISTWN